MGTSIHTPAGSYPSGSVLDHDYKDKKVYDQWTESVVEWVIEDGIRTDDPKITTEHMATKWDYNYKLNTLYGDSGTSYNTRSKENRDYFYEKTTISQGGTILGVEYDAGGTAWGERITKDVSNATIYSIYNSEYGLNSANQLAVSNFVFHTGTGGNAAYHKGTVGFEGFAQWEMHEPMIWTRIGIQGMLATSKPLGSTVQVNFNGGGAGVTFGEPSQVPDDFFKTGIEQLIPPAPEPQYEPMSTSGFTPVDTSAWGWAKAIAYDTG